MSLMPLFNGRKNHSRRVQNPSPAARITHQSQTNQDQSNLYDPPAPITHQFKINRGQQDISGSLIAPALSFYLETRRSLIAPALSFPHEPPSLAQVEFKTTPEAHVFRANLHGYKKEEVKFSTAFNLPDDARVDKVKSSMENGVLIVTVPKKGANKSNVRTVRIF
ncbi:hypothetical protein RND71_003806 [Anisodus tanguticus]|uniref:SHSP domain-containing protein n=1 Tax=Anisodus tanguticus TaxID=243964 RepID=A0AAE1SXC3_9SOLA|nr:hypothetical protein RND71_003806 [Anisodus tanguticus]